MNFMVHASNLHAHHAHAPNLHASHACTQVADHKYVIQGFGNVGAWASDIITEMGGKVIAGTLSQRLKATHALIHNLLADFK